MNPTEIPCAESTLFAADDARYAAMMAADLSALDRLLAHELVYTHSDGRVDDKAGYLASIASGTLRYLSCERETAIFQQYGDTAVLHGSIRLSALIDGRERSLHSRYLTVWIRTESSTWKLCAWASTAIPTAV